jgi:DNA (cytosine-5)-methyltransferase 1
MTLTVGSLFSGIGGLDLGLERAGHKVVWQSEIDPFACKVLKKHWPKVVNHGDIKRIDWATVEPVDIICGGYPCQPFSTAGKRKGTDDPRHLWPWVRTAISELRPRYAVLENVRGHLSLGGLQVVGELAEIGYDAEWRVVSAAGMGAPHRRDRIIIVAYPNGGRRKECESKAKPSSWVGSSSERSDYVANSNSGNATDGRQRENVQSQDQSGRNDRSRSGSDIGKIGLGSTRESSSNVANTDLREVGWRDGWNATDRSQVFGGRDYDRRTQSYEGWQWWEVEPSVGRVADGIPHRVDRLRGLGNAVVPQVAEYIGRLINTIG